MDNRVRQAAPREEQDVHGRMVVNPRSQAVFNIQVRDALNARYQSIWTTVTINATAVALFEMQQPTHCLWLVDARVQGTCATDGSSAFYERSARIKRTTGAATIVRLTTPVADDEDVAGWDIDLATDATGILTLSVTGDAARTIDWCAWVAVQEAPRRRTA